MYHLMRIVFVTVLAFLLISCAPPKKSTKKKATSRNKTKKLKSGINKEIDAIVKKLIKDKENLNQGYNAKLKKDRNGIPILLWAISFHDVNAVKLLLENGANPNINPKKGSTETALFEVPHSTDLESPKDVDLFDYRGKSAKICKLLIDAGADVKKANSFDDTPLLKAAGNGRDDICAILITAGANVNKQNKLGTTPLHTAASHGYWKVVQLLLNKGANSKSKDKLKQTALSLAEKRSDEDLYKKSRTVCPYSYANADYDKTIAILKK